MPGNTFLSSCHSRAQHDQLLCGGSTDTVSSGRRQLWGDGAYLAPVGSSSKSSYNAERVLGLDKVNFANQSIKYKTVGPLQLHLQTDKHANIETAAHLPPLPLNYRAEKTYPFEALFLKTSNRQSLSG